MYHKSYPSSFLAIPYLNTFALKKELWLGPGRYIRGGKMKTNIKTFTFSGMILTLCCIHEGSLNTQDNHEEVRRECVATEEGLPARTDTSRLKSMENYGATPAGLLRAYTPLTTA